MRDAVSRIWGMSEPWRRHLADYLASNPEVTKKGLSLAAGLNETFIRDVLAREDSSPRLDSLRALAHAMNMPFMEFVEGIQGPVMEIPIVGYVSAGESWSPIDDLAPGASFDLVEFSIDGADPIGLGVRGDSMQPVYHEGDTLIASRLHGANINDALQQDCIIKTATGDTYVKVLRRGSKAGLYTLRSYNPSYPDIENVALEWVAPVRWVKRSRT